MHSSHCGSVCTVCGAGKGSPRRDELYALSGSTVAPYLVDPNHETSMGESADIVEYLWKQYGGA
jgi:glutathione S-transferase